MDESTITIPRAVLAQLVDPQFREYIQSDDRGAWCSYCGNSILTAKSADTIKHDATCPVGMGQAALQALEQA